ncbi:helix-turn-helix domain-containing protein [Vibrio sp. DNB22_19_2]
MKSVQDVASLITHRRKALGLEQKDMLERIGMKQQQYQRIETGADIRLSNFLRVLDGLDLNLTVFPQLASSSERALQTEVLTSLCDEQVYYSWREAQQALKITDSQMKFLVIENHITLGVEFKQQSYFEHALLFLADSVSLEQSAFGQDLSESALGRLRRASNTEYSHFFCEVPLLDDAMPVLLVEGYAKGFWRFHLIEDLTKLFLIDEGMTLSVEITPYFGEFGYTNQQNTSEQDWLVYTKEYVSLDDVRIPASEVERMGRCFHEATSEYTFSSFPVGRTRKRPASVQMVDYLYRIFELLIAKGIVPNELLDKPMSMRIELERLMSIEGIIPPEISDSTLAQQFREYNKYKKT